MTTVRPLENVNVIAERTLPTPAEFKRLVPVSDAARATVLAGREAVKNVLDGTDERFLIIAGPCSVHDVEAAREYAGRLKGLADEVSDTIVLVMRVYFEKPRTVNGWKGFINDPRLDDSFHIEEGLLKARQLLTAVAELGLPAGTEMLDLITPQYLGDLISWTAIGARTTESQTHRELASGLSTPVGFKNGTGGDVTVAVNAVKSASRSHHFLSVTGEGRCAVYQTSGNPWGHVVLRGGKTPNYDAASVAACVEALRKANLVPNIVVDCSHGNSGKDYRKQPDVLRAVLGQRSSGTKALVGAMIESNLSEGNQEVPEDLSDLRYGVSITDSCIDWDTTAALVREARALLKG